MKRIHINFLPLPPREIFIRFVDSSPQNRDLTKTYIIMILWELKWYSSLVLPVRTWGKSKTNPGAVLGKGDTGRREWGWENTMPSHSFFVFLVVLGLHCLHGLLSSCGVNPRYVGSSFPDQGLNLCALYWMVDSWMLYHQGNPHTLPFFFSKSVSVFKLG